MARKARVPMCQHRNSCPTTKQTSCPTTTPRAEYAKQNGCMRPGPLQRNPYLNFLREFRKQNCGLSAIETVRRGAQAWKCLTAEQKAQYIVQAFYTKNHIKNLYRIGRRRSRKPKSPVRSRRKKRTVRRGRSRSKK